MVVANAITSRNLPGTLTFWERSGNPSETLHGSSGDRLETFGNIPGAVTAVRFYFRDASGTSSGFPSGSFRDPSGNAHFKAIISMDAGFQGGYSQINKKGVFDTPHIKLV